MAIEIPKVMKVKAKPPRELVASTASCSSASASA